MTIASEIERLQCAKADIRQAIIDKGVDVCDNLTIDNYACCINDISSGGGISLVDVMVIGGGGGGGNGYYCSSYSREYNGGGGGAGGVCIICKKGVESITSVTVGAGGSSNNKGRASWFGNIVADGGGRGGSGGCQNGVGGSGGSGGGSANIQSSGEMCCALSPGETTGCGMGNYGGVSIGKSYYNCTCTGGGGGGAGGAGCDSSCIYYNGSSCVCKPGYGGKGISNNFAGVTRCYAGGGGGGGGYCKSCNWGCGCYGGGDGGTYYSHCNGYDATTFGSGGGGAWSNRSYVGGKGCQGIVVVRYPTDGSYGITSATGGNTCRTCTIDGVEYCIHEFTSDGTFCITG